MKNPGNQHLFSQPIKQVFEPMFRISRHMPSPFDPQPVYRASAEDRFWYWLYLPIARLSALGSRLIGILQQGRISTYLAYSFVTLIVLLLLIQ